MEKHFDKVILFILCAVMSIQHAFGLYSVVPLICVIIIGAVMSYLDTNRSRGIITLLFFALCVPFPQFVFFLPVIMYEMFTTEYQPGLLLSLIPFSLGAGALGLMPSIFIVLLTVLSYVMRLHTSSLTRTMQDYIALRDSTKEFSLVLEAKNTELLEKQDYEINLATLNERNRIAREIHDSVGHTLSNAILQTGALIATTQDQETKSRLYQLKDTLVSGMDSVRTSVHALYEDSIDLYAELRGLCEHFDFCPISLEFDMDSTPDMKVKYALLNIVKETLSNVIRHSNATAVSISLVEHPALYQLTVKDNGTLIKSFGEGIGLKNITQRVESLGGYVSIGHERGFSIFISMPKARGTVV